MSRINRIDWIKIFFRSFYLQAALNYEGMQALGFAASMTPILKRVCRTEKDRISFLRRHLEFFNAHPYFASFALGAMVRLEETTDEGKNKTIIATKRGLCGPLGSLGDQLFWDGLRPLAGICGALIALHGNVLGPILFLLIYNVPHVWIRYWGLRRGYELGADVFTEFTRPLYKRCIKGIHALGAVAIGVFIGIEFVSLSGMNNNRLVPFFFFIIFCFTAIKRQVPMYVLIPAVMVVGFLIEFVTLHVLG